MGTPPPRRRGLVAQRAAVRRSAAKLKGLDASGSYSGAMKQRGQRAAVTRAANRLAAAEQSGRRRLRAGAQQGVIRSRQRPATGKPAVPKRLQRSEVEQAHRDKIARQIKALPKEVRRAIGVAQYGKSRPGVSEYRSFLGGKKLTTHELRGHLRDAGTRLILGIPAYGRRKLSKAERAKEAAMILQDTKQLRARLAMGPVRGKVRIRMARPANTVAKPKGLKPGALAERRAAKAARLSPARPTQRKSRRPTFAAIERASANYKRAIIGAAVDGGRSFTEAQRLMRIKGRTPQEESALRAASAAHRKGSRAVATAGAALEYYGIKVGSKEYTRMTRVTKKSVADAKRVDRASRPRRPS